VGVVPIAKGQPVSAGAQMARKMRKRLHSLGNKHTHFKARVIVSRTPWKDMQGVIHDEEPDLLVMEWKDGKTIWDEPVSKCLNPDLYMLRSSRKYSDGPAKGA
jgi:hypothetical protein